MEKKSRKDAGRRAGDGKRPEKRTGVLSDGDREVVYYDVFGQRYRVRKRDLLFYSWLDRLPDWAQLLVIVGAVLLFIVYPLLRR